MSVIRTAAKNGKGAPLLIEYNGHRAVFLDGFFITGTGKDAEQEVFEEMFLIALNLSKTTGKLVMYYKVDGVSEPVLKWDEIYKILSAKKEIEFGLTSSVELI